MTHRTDELLGQAVDHLVTSTGRKDGRRPLSGRLPTARKARQFGKAVK